MNAGPVAEHHGGFSPSNHINHPSGLEIGRYKFVRTSRLNVVPAAGPVARAADHTHNAFGIVDIQTRGKLHPGRYAAVVCVNVTKVVRDLRAEYVTHGIETRLGKLGKSSATVASGRRDAFAREVDILEDLQRVSLIGRDLISTPPGGEICVLHRFPTDLGKRLPRLEINHPRVRHHFGVNIPIWHHDFLHQFNAVLDFPAGPYRHLQIEWSNTGRERDNAVFALHPMLPAPLTEFSHERIRDL